MTDDVMCRCPVPGHRVHVGAGEATPAHESDDTDERRAATSDPVT